MRNSPGSRVRSALVGGLVLVAPGASLAGQSTAAQVSVSAGNATDERGVRSAALTVAPGITLLSRGTTTVALTGRATRFANAEWQLGGAGAVATRHAIGAGFSLALDAGADATRSSLGTTFTVAEVNPALEWRAGPVTLLGGAHAGYGHTSTPAGAPVLPGFAGMRPVSVTRTASGPVVGARVQPSGAPFWVSYRIEPTHVGDARVTEHAAVASVAVGPVTLAASASQRDDGETHEQVGAGSASFALTSSVSLGAASGRYLPNLLTGAVGGRYLSTSVSFRFGGSAEPQLPEASGVRPPLPTFTRLSIRAPRAARVAVAGDWNSWTPSLASRAGNGVWYVDVPLAPGEYRYAFQLDEREWRVPDGAVAVADDFGGKSAYITVRSAGPVRTAISREDPL